MPAAPESPDAGGEFDGYLHYLSGNHKAVEGGHHHDQ